MLESNTTLCKN